MLHLTPLKGVEFEYSRHLIQKETCPNCYNLEKITFVKRVSTIPISVVNKLFSKYILRHRVYIVLLSNKQFIRDSL